MGRAWVVECLGTVGMWVLDSSSRTREELESAHILATPRPFGLFHLDGSVVRLTMRGAAGHGPYGVRQEVRLPSGLERNFDLSGYRHRQNAVLPGHWGC